MQGPADNSETTDKPDRHVAQEGLCIEDVSSDEYYQPNIDEPVDIPDENQIHPGNDIQDELEENVLVNENQHDHVYNERIPNSVDNF